jgi:hypothetical protein
MDTKSFSTVLAWAGGYGESFLLLALKLLVNPSTYSMENFISGAYKPSWSRWTMEYAAEAGTPFQDIQAANIRYVKASLTLSGRRRPSISSTR